MSSDSTNDTGVASDTAGLVRRWRSGDLTAFEDIANRYSGALLSYLLSKFHHLQDAEDIAQDTLIRAHRSVGQLRDENRLWPWLKQIASNLTMDKLKQRKRWGISTTPEEFEQMQSRQPREADPPRWNVETISRAIQSLPETYRQTAVYYFLEEWPYARIAEVLGLEPATVRQRISRASRLLRTSLNQGINR